jgi:hypothetical protein
MHDVLVSFAIIVEGIDWRANMVELQGSWVAGMYEGQGKFTWADGRAYEGEWHQNKMHGQGTYIDINGHRRVRC